MRLERWVAVGLLVLVGCDGPPPEVAERAGVKGHSADVVALAYVPDGQKLVSRGADAIRVWDAATLGELAHLPSDGAEFGGLAISPDGKTIAATHAGQGVIPWTMPDQQAAASITELSDPGNPATSPAPGTFGWGLAFAPDGTLAGSNPDQVTGLPIQLWKVTRHKLREVGNPTTTALEPTGPGLPGRPATHLAFTPDGKSLIAKEMEGAIRVYDVASRTERRTIEAGLSYLTAIAVSPDGRTVASSGADRYLRLWSIESGREVARLKGHLKAILGLAFHPDGRHAVTGDSAGTIFLWDIPAGRVIAQFKGHQGKVWALAFRPDGKELASAGEDRQIRLWDVAKTIATYGQ